MATRYLYIFNPEHDLALASGETNYIAPASARQMATELALLPMWYAEKEAAVVASSAYNIEFLKGMERLFGNLPQLITSPELASEEYFEIIPWGWDLALCRQLSALGVNKSQLPSLQHIEEVRRCSHRSQAVELLSRLHLSDYFCGESSYLRTQEEWQSFVEAHKMCLLKAPLSGSGKGLNWCKGTFTSFISGWCNRIGAAQGGVIGEPIYNKVEDFAMEFSSDGEGRVSFVGYSRFRTSGGGMYAGNDLLSDEKIHSRLSEYVPSDELDKLRTRLEKELSVLIGSSYRGYLGVDMMICHFPTDAPFYRIHPCVEINLRMNMGVVAHSLVTRFLRPEAEGRFLIAYYPQEGAAWAEHEKMSTDFPLQVKNGYMSSGYLPLVPVSPCSHYRAWIKL